MGDHEEPPQKTGFWGSLFRGKNLAQKLGTAVRTWQTRLAKQY